MLNLARRTGIYAAQAGLFEKGQQGRKAVGFHGVVQAVLLLSTAAYGLKLSPLLAALTFGVVARERRVHLTHAQRNFGTAGGTLAPGFPYAGTWYDHFTGEAIAVEDVNAGWYLAPGELRVLLDTPLPVPDTDGDSPVVYPAGCADDQAVNFGSSAACVYDVVFAVGFEEVPVDPHIAGTFNGWDAGATPLGYDAATDRYRATLQLGIGEGVEYKFLSGAAWGTDETVPGNCGVGDGPVNRAFTLGVDLAGPAAACFGSCADCTLPDGSGFCGPGTVWDATLFVCLPDPACVEDLNDDGVVSIADMLQLLSAFGDSCL